MGRLAIGIATDICRYRLSAGRRHHHLVWVIRRFDYTTKWMVSGQRYDQPVHNRRRIMTIASVLVKVHLLESTVVASALSILRVVAPGSGLVRILRWKTAARPPD